MNLLRHLPPISRCSTPTGIRPVRTLALLWLVCCGWPAAWASQGSPSLWLVSSRNACCCDPQQLHIRCDRHGRFVPLSLEQFRRQQRAELPLIFWIHGNRVSASEASVIGRRVYRALARQTTQPFQMVIWSWPSQKQGGPLRDARIKAAVADRHGAHLARFLETLADRPRIGLWGYSYGARMILAALHKMRDSDPEPSRSPPRYQVVLWVPGVEDTALAPWGRFGRAWDRTEHVLLVTNCSDRALRWYPWVEGRCGPEALGRVGPRGLAPRHRRQLRRIEASPYVGPRHDWARMLAAPAVLAPTVQLLLQAPAGP